MNSLQEAVKNMVINSIAVLILAAIQIGLLLVAAKAAGTIFIIPACIVIGLISIQTLPALLMSLLMYAIYPFMTVSIFISTRHK